MVEARKLTKFQRANGTGIGASSELLSSTLKDIKAQKKWEGLYQFSFEGVAIDADSEAYITLD